MGILHEWLDATLNRRCVLLDTPNSATFITAVKIHSSPKYVLDSSTGKKERFGTNQKSDQIGKSMAGQQSWKKGGIFFFESTASTTEPLWH